MIRVSEQFVEALRLSGEPNYRTARKAGLHPSTLSQLVLGISNIQNNDSRVIAIGRVLGLQPSECFSEDAAE
jgi:hypothetical protein